MAETAMRPMVSRWRVVAGGRRRLENVAHMDEYIVARFHLRDGHEAQAPLTAPLALEMGVGVAVCTYRRPASVARFIESLMRQSPAPDQVILVDASPDDLTERVVRDHVGLHRFARRIDYLRVRPPLAGLTPQRNVALHVADTDLIAFFDDDIVLLPGCLAAMARAHRADPGPVAGVGAVIENEREAPPALWRMRRALRIVPSLHPGRYTRSGFQIPWRFLPPSEELVEGEWLPGGATMWNTALAREIGFHEGLDGYASGEDLEFSLRMSARGKIGLAGGATLLHLHDANARPDQTQMGYMGLRNLYYIHQSCRPRRRWIDTLYFFYGYGLDTVVWLLTLLRPGNVRARWEFVRGRLRFFREFMGVRLPWRAS